MNYEDKKIVGIIATNVDAATALNVSGQLSVAIGKYSDDAIMGRPILTDKSGINHMGISRFPFIVTKVKPNKLKVAIDKAKEQKAKTDAKEAAERDIRIIDAEIANRANKNKDNK